MGIDVYLYSEETMEALQKKLLPLDFSPFTIEMISNRGARVYPDGIPETFCIDQWRVRFRPSGTSCTQKSLVHLLEKLTQEGLDIIKTEHLYDFDGKPGYSSPKG